MSVAERIHEHIEELIENKDYEITMDDNGQLFIHMDLGIYLWNNKTLKDHPDPDFDYPSIDD